MIWVMLVARIHSGFHLGIPLNDPEPLELALLEACRPDRFWQYWLSKFQYKIRTMICPDQLAGLPGLLRRLKQEHSPPVVNTGDLLPRS